MQKGFRKGDFVIIQKSKGEGMGNFEINIIEDIQEENFTLRYPLTNDYKNDFANSSQVVRIPQNSRITITKDANLFHKPASDGKGGLVALMSNSGFEIKGYISDKSISEEEVTEKISLTKSKSALLAVLANYKNQKARKVVDFKFTRTFPMIALPADKKILLPQEKTEYDLDKFQHITIPPDLNIHLTSEKKQKERKFLGLTGLVNKEGFLQKKYQKILTVVFPPINSCPIFTNKKYGACLVIAQAQMPHWNENTHFILELFAIKNEKVRIPRGVHHKGELGAFFPYPYAGMAKTFDADYRHGNFFLQPFVIANHEKNDTDSVEIYWGSH